MTERRRAGGRSYRARYEHLKARGICVLCQRQSAVPQRVCCQACLQRVQETSRHARLARRLERQTVPAAQRQREAWQAVFQADAARQQAAQARQTLAQTLQRLGFTPVAEEPTP